MCDGRNKGKREVDFSVAPRDPSTPNAFGARRRKGLAPLGMTAWANRSVVWVAVILLLLASCNRMATPANVQRTKDGDEKAKNGDYTGAIDLYEASLDGTLRAAEAHYRLALLYDDKLNDPLDALHHFKRYLVIAPNGTHAVDAKNFMKRDELALLTNLSGDTVVPRSEVVRLRNENLALRQHLEETRAAARAAGVEVKSAPSRNVAKKKTAPSRKGNGQTYVVKRGDTLASISRRFYKSSSHWQKIRRSNGEKIDDPQNLKVGEVLTIP